MDDLLNESIVAVNPRIKRVEPGTRFDRKFVQRLWRILKVCVPSLHCKSSLLILAIITLIVVRTRMTVIISRNIGQNAKNLVERNLRDFARGVAFLGYMALPASVTNAAIRYLVFSIGESFRKNLQLYLHKEYTSCHTVYYLKNASEEQGGIQNPDYCLTQDVCELCISLSELFPSLIKPLIDVLTFVPQLAIQGGYLAPLVLMHYYVLVGGLMQFLPNQAKLFTEVEEREAGLRNIHTQIIQHAEEVAFYNGEETERRNADRGMRSLTRHLLVYSRAKSLYDFVDSIFLKYGATCVAYLVCAIGVFRAKGSVSTAAELTNIYIRDTQLYIPLARAVSSLAKLHKSLSSILVRVTRVSELLEAMQRVRVQPPDSVFAISRCDEISFDNVSIHSPEGAPLVKNLSFRLRRQESLLITGPNGSGKSAILRAIAGIQAVSEGTIRRPSDPELVFVPQRAFLPSGNFRSLLTYPDSTEEAGTKGVSDDELLRIAKDAGIDSVILREGGLNAEKKWHEVLSGGERQRVAFARVYYHRPVFALLDECTSGVSQEMEPGLYEQAHLRGITLVTVSHRATLKDFHSRILALDGLGGFTLSNCN